jgi:hypothetical protein
LVVHSCPYSLFPIPYSLFATPHSLAASPPDPGSDPSPIRSQPITTRQPRGLTPSASTFIPAASPPEALQDGRGVRGPFEPGALRLGLRRPIAACPGPGWRSTVRVANPPICPVRDPRIAGRGDAHVRHRPKTRGKAHHAPTRNRGDNFAQIFRSRLMRSPPSPLPVALDSANGERVRVRGRCTLQAFQHRSNKPPTKASTSANIAADNAAHRTDIHTILAGASSPSPPPPGGPMEPGGRGRV